MNRRDFLGAVGAALAGVSRASARSILPGWKAGVATADITPDTSLWMAGFARRSRPAQGVALPLKAKALALQAGNQRPAVLVTLDLLGTTARITSRVAADVRRLHGIRRENLLLNASHTHCGPVVDEHLSVAYDLSASQLAAIRTYTAHLEQQLVGLIGRAVERLVPVRLSYSRGQATFAANRRVKFTPDGPVDHSVPVLTVEGGGEAPLAIVFGYACHNTTLQDSFVQYHGDYAGVAQASLEQRHRRTVAMFVAGCGADANPKPRGTLEFVQAHGEALADAVDRALPDGVPVAAVLDTAYGSVELPFVSEPERQRWRKGLDIEEAYLQRHDALMQAIVARAGRLPGTQTMPVQVWRFGPRLTLVALGGEVVVDYAQRLARELPERDVWAAGYSNDVFGYVPSRRVLREGGYEGGDAMIYYGLPGPFTEAVEELIFGKVRELIAR